MSILITGVNGFVGKVLYEWLSANQEVIGIARRAEATGANIYAVDLTNEKDTLAFFEKHKNAGISCVIHLASRTASKENLNNLSVLTDNTSIARNVALGANLAGIHHVIHLSSSSVYANVDGSFDEGMPTDPSKNADAIYGLSKYNAEVMFDYFLPKHAIVTHLRTAMIHGDGMDASRIIPTLMNEIRVSNSATVFGDGERLLNLVHVDKLSGYISFFAANPQSGIFNVADECISMKDLATRLIAQYGDQQTRLIVNPAGNRQKFVLDVNKLKAVLKKGNV